MRIQKTLFVIVIALTSALAVLARFGIARYLDSEVYRGHVKPAAIVRPGAGP